MVWLLFFIFGLILGSFINAFIYRFRHKIEQSGRSFCPKCKKKIFWYDNIPLLSWLLLKAKCRHCKQTISVQYPIVELLAGLLTLVAAQKAGLLSALNRYLNQSVSTDLGNISLFLLLNSIFLILLAISLYDLKTKEIPNSFNVLFVLVALTYLFKTQPNVGNISSIYPYLLAGIVAFGLFWALVYFSKETWMGGGDAKLMFGIGLFLGPILTFLTVFVASVVGSSYGVGMLLIRNGEANIKKGAASHEIPFGPFLAFGCIISYLFGSQIVDWYARIFLGL